ncbi:MAG TPA: Crp/Fnr family transcriptional regulator [Longimicrobiales bacterium]|nr:Crp/Fnr family transcriptional regulator [Longimicrobiales bacterium]
MHRNSILNALSEDEREFVSHHLEAVTLNRRKLLYDVDVPIEHVYFITEGVASIVSFLDDGTSVETATVGCEGMVGIGVYLGTPVMSEQAFVQIEGGGYRMSAEQLRECLRGCEHLSALLGRYTSALLRLLAQTSACNRRHAIVQRCARWLLMTHDRAGRDTFELTQQFLSQMLGVRRATVSAVAMSLQKAGCIEYSRGRITILDRKGLEREACECHAVIRNEFARAGAIRHG